MRRVYFMHNPFKTNPCRLLAITGILWIFNLSSISQGTVATDTNPNVLLIICDDLNDAVHGLGGHPQAISPAMDDLAENGVRFTAANTNAPICSPSRASLWSGLYPHTTGFYGYDQQKNHWRNNHVLKNTVTLFEHFVSGGYQVYATGKIHHNGHGDMEIFTNADGKSGFRVMPSFGPYPWNGKDETNEMKIRGNMHPDMPPEFQNERWSEGFGPVKDISDAFQGNGAWLYDHRGNTFRFNSADDRDNMPDENCTEYAIEILQREHSKPFFLTIGYNRPHTPQYVPEKFFDLFPLDSMQLPPYLKNDLEDCPEIVKQRKDFHGIPVGAHKFNKLLQSSDSTLWLKWVRAYLASVAFVDNEIGKVLEELSNSPYSENTMIILTSDHGYHMGEKNLLFKNTNWEESARIPLVIAGPGIEAGKECHKPVSLIDIYPTLIDYCQLDTFPNREGNRCQLDGYSLREYLEDPLSELWKGPSVALTAVTSQDKLAVNQPGKIDKQHYSLRSERYRYILYSNGEEELYDHKYDPHEWYNLASDPYYLESLEGFKKLLYETLHH